jgi:selenoprotein W-related protein
VAETAGVKVTITYCAECGYEPQTLALTEALMKTFAHQLTSIELVPWYEGSFDVAVNGQLVHSMYRDGGFPDHSTVIAAVKKQLATAA